MKCSMTEKLGFVKVATVLIFAALVSFNARATLICEGAEGPAAALPDNLPTVVEHQVLEPSVSSDRQDYGWQVDIEGEIMALSQYRNPEINESSVSIFAIEGGTWVPKKLLPPPHPQVTDISGFGSVALDGNHLLVGAQWYCADDTHCRNGTAYIFDRNAGGTDNWGLVKQLQNGTPDSWYGSAVDIDGSIAAVGARHENNGAVYIFDKDVGGVNNWGLLKKLEPGLTAPMSGGFGVELKLVDDTLIARAAERVFVFGRNEGGANNWGFVQEILYPCQLHFGGVSFDGETLITHVADNIFSNERDDGFVFYEKNKQGVWERKTDLDSPVPLGGLSLKGGQLIAGADAFEVVGYLLQRDSATHEWAFGTRLARSNGSLLNNNPNVVEFDSGHAVIAHELEDVGGFDGRGIAFAYDIPENIRINPGMNDAWYNPETSGQGFFITVFPDLGAISLAWFTYDTELPPVDAVSNLGDPGHRWLTAVGPINGNKAILDIEMTSGGLFDTPTEIQRTDPPGSDGTITLTFDNCNSGTIVYDIPSINRQGIVPIQRVATDNVLICEALNAN